MSNLKSQVKVCVRIEHGCLLRTNPFEFAKVCVLPVTHSDGHLGGHFH